MGEATAGLYVVTEQKAEFFFAISIGNHMIFLVQFGINKHE